MKNYKIKDQYKGLIITRNVFALGQVTFDPSKVDPKDYKNYVKMGFEELFEEVIEEIIQLIVEEVKDVIEDIKEDIQERTTKRRNNKTKNEGL